MFESVKVDTDEIVRLYESGLTLMEVGERVGCSWMTVQRRLKASGVKLRHVGRKTRDGKAEVDLDAIEREYLGGASCYELGDRYGVHHATISKWMRQRGHERGKGNSLANQSRMVDAERRFIAEFPDLVDAAASRTERGHLRRRYRIVSRPHDGPSSGLTWQKVYERNGHDLTCWICKKKCMPNDKDMGRRPSIDHVTPLSNGGTDTYDNVRIACCDCNSRRSNRVQLTLDYLIYEGVPDAQEQTA